MSEENHSSGRAPLSPATVRVRLAVIGGVVLVAAILFLWDGGWLTPGHLTPGRMVAALSDRGGNPLGHRRNHAKGICFTGVFVANGAGSRYSTAPMLATGSYPVIGRFAIAVGDPDAPDATGRVKRRGRKLQAHSFVHYGVWPQAIRTERILL
jgi:catalase